MLRRLIALAATAVLMAAAPVSAFTPESGFYWNPAEPGSGLTIEIQDNYVFLIGYVYDTQGRATWLTAQGLMPTVSPGTNSRFNSVLDSFSGGQCIGCAYTAPIASLGSGGPVSLNWTTEIEATLTWGGRTIPLQRFDYYLSRTGGIQPRTELMLGEWQAIFDVYESPNGEGEDFPYFGEVLVFTAIDTTTDPDQATGCRPITSLDGRCTNEALAAHDASVAFSPIASGDFERTHVIVVTDVAGSGSTPDQYLAYYVTVGTSQFDGVMEFCDAGDCGEAGARLYPVRGFRTASRSFVQAGVGPSSEDKALAPASVRGLADRVRGKDGKLPKGLSVADAKARFGIDVTLHRATVDALIAGQQARR